MVPEGRQHDVEGQVDGDDGVLPGAALMRPGHDHYRGECEQQRHDVLHYPADNPVLLNVGSRRIPPRSSGGLFAGVVSP
jgi:hypothetical protein